MPFFEALKCGRGHWRIRFGVWKPLFTADGVPDSSSVGIFCLTSRCFDSRTKAVRVARNSTLSRTWRWEKSLRLSMGSPSGLLAPAPSLDCPSQGRIERNPRPGAAPSLTWEYAQRAYPSVGAVGQRCEGCDRIEGDHCSCSQSPLVETPSVDPRPCEDGKRDWELPLGLLEADLTSRVFHTSSSRPTKSKAQGRKKSCEVSLSIDDLQRRASTP